MKIIHIELGRHLYGGARQVAYLLNGMTADSGEHLLVASQGAAVLESITNPIIRTHPIAFAGDLDLTYIQRLRRVIQSERPDALHIHSRRGDWLSALAGWQARIPMIYSRRVDNPPHWLERHGKFPLFRTVITISQGIREVLIEAGVDSDRVVCIPSAVDTDCYTPNGDRSWFRTEFGLPDDALTVGMVAQLIPRKGHHILFEALPEVLSRHAEVRVLLFGQGPLAEELTKTITQNGWQERVILAGFRRDLERVIPCLDVLVHPALMEGLGVSLLEAAAAGVPIIASRVGGIPEVVKPGLTGELIPPNDSQALCEHLQHLIPDSDRRQRYGLSARAWVLEHFSIERMVRDNCAVYGR